MEGGPHNTHASMQELLEKVEKLQNYQPITSSVKKGSQILLFFSFDIVNSTAFKASINQWPKILSLIFRRISNAVRQELDRIDVEIWRILGDEIIFYIPISSLESVFGIVDSIYRVLQKLCTYIKDGRMFLEHRDSSIKVYTQQLRNLLSLKASAWIVRVDNIDDEASIPLSLANKTTYNEAEDTSLEEHVSGPMDNITVQYYLGDSVYVQEFLGSDIDEGFRLSEMVVQRRMIVNYSLAYLLSEQTAYLERLHIISYESLKGIWHERPYPVIWYYNPLYSNDVPFENSFYYDEAGEEKLSRKYFENRSTMDKLSHAVLNRNMYTNVREALIKLSSDLFLFEKIDRIKKCLAEAPNNESRIKRKVGAFELDCVAVCFVEIEGSTQVFVAKHSADAKYNNADKWHFGGYSVLKGDSIPDKLCNYYKAQFNIEIELYMDTTKRMPQPVRIYEATHKGADHKGIIMVAKILGGFENLTTDAHNPTVCLMTIDEAQELSTEETVPDFKETLNAALNLYTMRENGEGDRENA